MINTIKGEMNEELLECKKGTIENENEKTEWIEYYDGEELVHRSVHVTLKKNVVAESIAQFIG